MAVTLLPVDNALWSAARFAGLCLARQQRVRLSLPHGARPTARRSFTPGTGSVCNGAGITTLPASAGGGTAGRVVNLNASSFGSGSPAIGMNVFVYQQVRYQLRPLALRLPAASLSGGRCSTAARRGTRRALRQLGTLSFLCPELHVAQDAVPVPRSLTRGHRDSSRRHERSCAQGSPDRKADGPHDLDLLQEPA